MIANRVAAFGVKRRVVVRPPIARNEGEDTGLRWLMLVPAGSLLMAGLLVIALSRIVGGPVLQPTPSSVVGADVEVRDVEGQMDADEPLVVKEGATGRRLQKSRAR